MKPNSDTVAPSLQGTEARKYWMGVLARTGTGRLEEIYSEINAPQEFEHLRPPEIGMAMVRARTEAKGSQSNLGEMTVSRCSVQLSDGLIGHGYVAGRDKRHAELAAVFDALLQTPGLGPRLYEVIEGLDQEHAARQKEQQSKIAATKVNFFTMARGED